MNFQQICLLILLQVLLLSNAISAVARYAIKSVSARSVVIEANTFYRNFLRISLPSADGGCAQCESFRHACAHL